MSFQYLYNIFFESCDILEKVVLTIFSPTGYEKDLVEDDPSTYLELCLDLCGNQKGEEVGNAAGRLLEGIAKYMDGGLTRVVRNCVQVVKGGVETGGNRGEVVAGLKMLCVLSFMYM